MDNLINELMNKADLDEKAAEKVLEVVKGFIEDKLPDTVSGPVINALDGVDADDAMDAAKDILGKLF